MQYEKNILPSLYRLNQRLSLIFRVKGCKVVEGGVEDKTQGSQPRSSHSKGETTLLDNTATVKYQVSLGLYIIYFYSIVSIFYLLTVLYLIFLSF